MSKGLKFSWIIISFIITTILVFISEWIQTNNIINFPLGFRHFLILLLFVTNWIFYGQKITLPGNYKLGITLISLFLLIAYFFSPATLFNYALGIVFTFLFLIMFILGINTKTRTVLILKIFKILLIIFILMSIFSIYQMIITGTSLVNNRGLFREAGALGATMNIGTIIGISLFIITSKKKYLYIAAFFSIVVLMTILKKNIISNLIVWLAFSIYHANSKLRIRLIICSTIILVFVFMAMGGEFINNINLNADYLTGVGAEGHVRLGMYLASFNIAKDFFPFGSGMGTFGSLASIIGGYSSIHFDYGVAYIGANSPESVAAGTHTLLDTYWPHIFGELGFIGAFLFLYLWFYPIRLSFLMIRLTKDPFIKGLSFYITLIVIVMFWEGFSLYTPEIPSFVLLHSGLSGLCYYHIKRNSTSKSL